MRKEYWAILFLSLLSAFSCLQAQGDHVSVIKWDTWGVPHISGETDAEAYYAFGWAQMKAHGDIILKSYGKARGRSAEYWGGKQNLQSDLTSRKLNVPQRAHDWYAAQNGKMKELISSFVLGMNAFCEHYPEAISEEFKVVLPLENTDPLAQLQLTYHLAVGAYALQPQAAKWKNAGSNAWAIGPSKSVSGNAMLLMQPHPPWFDDYLFFEAHLKSKDRNIYGIALVGSPAIAMGFNENLGWALTFNQADAMDLIELEVINESYLVDGIWKPLKIKEDIIAVKEDAVIRYDTIQVKQSDFGFIVEEKEGKAIALRLSGFDRPFFIEQFNDMAQSSNLDEFQMAMKKLQLPLQNIIYADRNGAIFYLYNGIIPKRPAGSLSDWSKVISASTPGALVKEYVLYEDLPKFKNPKSGFISNSNNGPWTSTYPFVAEPKDYPSYITDKPYKYFNYRSVRSIKMLLSEEKVDFDKVVELQSSTHAEFADRTVDELVSFGEESSDSLLQKAAVVLKNWDRKLDAQSIGAVLFVNWYFKLNRKDAFKVQFSAENPLNTPNTLTRTAKEMLSKAAEEIIEKYGELDVRWGDVYGINYAGASLKGGLGLNEVGSFNAGFYGPSANNTYTLLGGSAFSSVIEFGEKIKAKGILSYGNASQNGSPFKADQLQLLVDRKLRDIWFYQEDIDKHIYLVETLKYEKPE